MLVFDPIAQGLSLLAERELQRAEQVFLRVINDPYAPSDDLVKARSYLKDIRDCQSGRRALDFDVYAKLVKQNSFSLAEIDAFLSEVYFSSAQTFEEIDLYLDERLDAGIGRLKQVKICDIMGRDKLFSDIEKNGKKFINRRIREEASAGDDGAGFNQYRWKTIYRKFVEKINPIILERHLELLEYILESGDISLLDDPKLTALTSKYRWIIQSSLKNKWFLLRSYFFKARSDVAEQINKKEGNRKYWDDVKYKKIKIFEKCGFSEQHIQKFLFIDKLNYKTLDEIYAFATELELKLIPRDVSLALRGVEKAKSHIKERAGILMGYRKQFQEELRERGFSKENSYKIAQQAKRANCKQITDAFDLSLKVALDEIYWYRIPPQSEELQKDVERQCRKHLSTVRIHLFDRGRLNKLLLKAGKASIRDYLIANYGEEVVSLQCYFRLETIHQYYKLKFFQYHAPQIPSVSELIKISRKDFKPILLNGYDEFIKKRRLNIPQTMLDRLDADKSVTGWEDAYTTPQEKALLRFWFLMDHGSAITQSRIEKGVLKPGFDLWAHLKQTGSICQT
ncbi:MAG: hypothetical protein G3M78_08985 [Candidatus Nitrohelix vancouverensis]|uniref:Uncharacterized protein n=1 Tax=Candidatus Nitrohelix vancouverensis TaxID=2705534 RepID=A0A7T0G3M0_9BACT|nr:MAG: hypothetical protein G3M78_08985 [Candidatus Nitrohelix vancouverensis]